MAGDTESDEEREANDRALKEMEEDLAQNATDESEAVEEIAFADTADEGHAPQETERPSRTARRQARYDDAIDRAAKLEAQNELLQRQLREQREARAQPAPPAPPAEDPLDELLEQEERLYAEIERQKETMSQEDVRYYQQKVRDLKKAQLRAAQPKQMTQEEVMRLQATQKYPDVYASPEALEYASGYFRMARAQNRGANPTALFDESMEAARRKILNNTGDERRERTPEERDRYAAPGRAGAAAKRPAKVFAMKHHHVQMADAAFPEITDDKERRRHWVNTVGRDLMENDEV